MQLSQKQKTYLVKANRRWNLKQGAVRSGKSYGDFAATIPMRIRERIGQEGLVVIMGVSKETIERNILEPMRTIYTDQLVGYINSRNVVNIFGEKAYCLGAEKVSQVAKIQGSSIKYCYGDEVAKWNKEVFQMLKSRLDKSYSCFDGSFNPEYPTHWLKEFIDSDIDKYLQSYTIFDNPFLDKGFVKNLCAEYEGTIYYDRYILGLWKRAEGAIYRKFADEPETFKCVISNEKAEGLKTFKPSDIIEIVVGIDFGGTKSGHAFVATAKTRNYKELIALKSRRYFGEYDSNDIDKLATDFVGDVIKTYGYVDYAYWDNAESVLGRGVNKAITDKFPNVIVRPARKIRIKDRIDCSVRLMGAGRFFYTDDCETLETALTDAVWNSKSEEDERLDDGTSDIDTCDSFEYTFERDIRHYIEA